MKIMEAIDRNPTLTGQLLEVWESSVKATHLFLSEEELCATGNTGNTVFDYRGK